VKPIKFRQTKNKAVVAKEATEGEVVVEGEAAFLEEGS